MNEFPQDNPALSSASSASATSTSYDQPIAPEDVFGAFHYAYYPRFKNLVAGLGKTAMKKLLFAVGDIPNSTKLDKGFTKEQKEAYLILDKLLLARFSTLFGGMLKEMEKQQEQQKVVPNSSEKE